MSDQNQTRRELLQKTALVAGAAALASATQALAQSTPAAEDTSAWKKFFPEGFRNERIKTSGAEINTLIGARVRRCSCSTALPIRSSHGTRLLPDLAKDYTLVLRPAWLR
jgi:hypothetical protein